MKDGLVSYVAAIDKASIVITLLLSFILLKEPFTPKIPLGGVFILVEMLILGMEVNPASLSPLNLSEYTSVPFLLALYF